MRLRTSLVASILLVTPMAGGVPAFAADKYPNKEVTWIVPFAAGGGADRWTRILSPVATDLIGQPMLVRNMPGASAIVGWKYVLGQPADGYTILHSSPTPIISLLLESEESRPIQPNQIKIVAFLSSFRPIIAVAKGKPWSTWDGFVKYAKDNPGKLTLGATSSELVSASLVFKSAGINVTLVPYASTGPSIADFLGGHFDAVSATESTIAPLVPDKAVAILNASDLALSKEVAEKLGNPPLATDLGHKAISFPRWVGVHPDTPNEIADEISRQIGVLLKREDVVVRINKIGEDIGYLPRKEAQAKYNELVDALRVAAPILKMKPGK